MTCGVCKKSMTCGVCKESNTCEDCKKSMTWGVFKKVAIELFCFADSNVSLIQDAIDLFRIFQRVSASRTFYARFSSDCYKLFQWAKNFVAMITNAIVPKEHFCLFDIFQLYCLASNIFMANFILILFTSHRFILFLPFFGLAIMFGVGYSYANYNGEYVVILLTTACIVTIFAVLGMLCRYVPCTIMFCSFYRGIHQIAEDGAKSLNKSEFLKLTMMMVAGAIVFSTATSSIMFRHQVIGIYICAICTLVIVVAFVYEIIMHFCRKPIKISNYLIELVNQIIGLCLVPGTEAFIQLCLTAYGAQWNIVLSFIVLTVIYPLLITVMLILSNYDDLTDTYKDKGWFDYRYLEIVDLVHRILYAILAALDIPGACIGIEGAWLVLLIILRPYNSYSDTILNMGESIIMIIGNTAALAGSGFFSFGVSVTFVVFTTTPVIASVITYFALEFEIPAPEEKTMDDVKGKKEEELPQGQSMEYLAITALFLAPISWFLFGTNVRTMFDTI